MKGTNDLQGLRDNLLEAGSFLKDVESIIPQRSPLTIPISSHLENELHIGARHHFIIGSCLKVSFLR